MSLHFFAPAPRGLESVLATELEHLGAYSVEQVPGGISFTGDNDLVYLTNLYSKIATRILLRLDKGYYKNEQDIYDLVYNIDWVNWFEPTHTIKVFVMAIHSPLRSLDFITLKIKDAICDRFRSDTGIRPSVDSREPDIRIHAFLHENQVTIYLDTSGEPLYKRRGRPGTHLAPLKENLAAGILHLIGWKPGIPLIDPMCGGATLLIEAANWTLNIAPGIDRHFAFEKLLGFDQLLWSSIRQKAKNQQKEAEALPIFGADLYGDALKIARQNVEAANLLGLITLHQANVLELKRPFADAVVIMNPPYGVRLDDQETDEMFYQNLGDRLKQHYKGCQVWILFPELTLPEKIRLKPKRRIPIFNGNIECRIFGFDIVDGSFRRERKTTVENSMN